MSWTSAYRAALHLLPAELRRKHGRAMEDLFTRELFRAGGRGLLHRSLAGAAGVLDVVWRAAYERVRPGYDIAEPAGASVEHLPAPLPTTRELLRRYAVSFAVAFAGLTTALVGLFGTRNMPALLSPREVPAGTIVEMLLLAVPFTAALTIPMAVLVAILHQLTRLGAEGTLAAAERPRGGMGRLIMPVLAASLAVATLELVLVAEIVPRTNERLVSLLGSGAPASNGRTMTIGQLQAAARRARAGVKPDNPAGAARYEIEIQKKLALPAACVVMALVGIAVALRVRRSGAWLVAGVSCVVFVGYYMIMVTGEGLANRRVISPVIGMWGANVLLLGVVLLALSRRRAPLGAFTLVIAALLSPTASASAQGTDAVAAATRGIYAAISSADTVALRQLLAQDMHWVSANSGAVAAKGQLLTAASRRIPDVKLEYQLDSVQSWKRGDVAGVEYVLTNRRTFRAYQTVFVSRASDTYVNEQGRWQLLRHVQSWIVQSPDTTALDSLRLAAFVGRYDRGHGYIDDVHFHEGHLVAQSTYEALMGAPGAHLFPVSADTFSPERSAPMIVFERDEVGRVVGYVQQQPDGTVARAPRLAAP
jgi:lipopolysaccharide export LptBFGC system permease protein LptF